MISACELSSRQIQEQWLLRKQESVELYPILDQLNSRILGRLILQRYCS